MMSLNFEEDTVAEHGHLVEEKEHSHGYEDRFTALKYKLKFLKKNCQNITNPGSPLQERMGPQDLMVLTSLQTGKHLYRT